MVARRDQYGNVWLLPQDNAQVSQRILSRGQNHSPSIHETPEMHAQHHTTTNRTQFKESSKSEIDVELHFYTIEDQSYATQLQSHLLDIKDTLVIVPHIGMIKHKRKSHMVQNKQIKQSDDNDSEAFVHILNFWNDVISASHQNVFETIDKWMYASVSSLKESAIKEVQRHILSSFKEPFAMGFIIKYLMKHQTHLLKQNTSTEYTLFDSRNELERFCNVLAIYYQWVYNYFWNILRDDHDVLSRRNTLQNIDDQRLGSTIQNCIDFRKTNNNVQTAIRSGCMLLIKRYALSIRRNLLQWNERGTFQALYKLFVYL